MATLGFALTSTPLTNTKNYTLSDADVSRFIAACKTRYASVLPASPTNAQALVAWADDVMETTKRMVRSEENKAAVASGTDISAS